jgi:hypothetical protein
MLNERRRKSDQERTAVADDWAERPANVAQDLVRSRAYELYEARGSEDGHDVEDWLQAERELRYLE